MRREGYRIADEPAASPLSKFAVSPLWPMLGVMFGGAGLSWSWFALNSFAIGSATRKRELGLVVFGLALTSGLVLLLLSAEDRGLMSPDRFAYAVLPVIAVKLTVCYRLQLMQMRSHQLYRYFGGISRSGVVGLVLGYLLRKSLFELPLAWALILS
ncbi:MAG TPA: hypothetical protein VNW92_12700 [Polyangiaceae bacterium]|jgi:hypothetical protein|nr:hypothetical protein [Polyangiaceae bacterium]